MRIRCKCGSVFSTQESIDNHKRFTHCDAFDDQIFAAWLWYEYVNKDLCGLCGNSGYVDTTTTAVSAAGVQCGVRMPCI